jgi:hypothetical protein
MSLDWQIGDIKDWKAVCKQQDGTLSPITHGLIWMTMLVDLGGITEKNFEEWLWRLEFYHRIEEDFQGDYDVLVEDDVGKRWVSKPFTAEDIRRHIGLRTNVLDTTRAAFVKKLVDKLKRDVYQKVQQTMKGATLKKPEEEMAL